MAPYLIMSIGRKTVTGLNGNQMTNFQTMVGGGVEHVDAELLHLGLLAHLADILVGRHPTVFSQLIQVLPFQEKLT